jgi:hypothetical protein
MFLDGRIVNTDPIKPIANFIVNANHKKRKNEVIFQIDAGIKFI